MNQILAAFTPNKAISKSTLKLLICLQVGLFFLVWAFSPFVFLPSIRETASALSNQWSLGLGGALVISFTANLEAIGVASLLSLGLAYLTVLKGMRPIIDFLCKLRFLSMIGLGFFFTIMTHNDNQLKISLLVFSISVFFVTSMTDVIATIPKEQYDLARTLGMGPWRTVWEVVVLGQIDKAFDVLRQNAAIGWMMLTMVESRVMGEGGIGSMLVTEDKHLFLPAILAIQLTIFSVGIGQDYLIGAAKNLFCPYSNLAVERK